MGSRMVITWRHYLAVRGPLLAVAVVILALSGVLAAAPTIFSRLADAEITQTSERAPLAARYLLAHPGGRILSSSSADPTASGLGDLDDMFGGWQDQLAAVQAGLPEPLRSHIGPAGWTIAYRAIGLGPNPNGSPASSRTELGTTFDPHPDRVADLVEGTWPDGTLNDASLHIAVSRDTATTLGVALGDDMGVFTIVGIFQPIDAGADYWQLNPGLARAAVFDDGNNISVTAGSFIGGQQAGMLPIAGAPGSFQGLAGDNLVWYPLDLSGMTPSEARQILAQLKAVSAAPRPAPPHASTLPPDALRGVIDEIPLEVGAVDALAGALGRIDAASSVLTAALSGPLIAAVAVLVATVLMLLRRGAPTTAQLAMRGAGRGRIRLHWIGAGLIAGVVPAVAAVIAVRVAAGPQAAWVGLLLGALVGLLPAVLLGVVPVWLLGTEPARQRSGSRAGRVVAELTVIAVAAVSVYLLLTTADTASNRADLLVVAAPALLIAAAGVVVMRLYPIPVRALASWMRRRRGPVGFLGSIRALRDPIVGAVPVVAILAGLAVAGMSAVLLTTIDAGTERAALEQLGAPIRVTSTSVDGISDDEYRRIEQVPGVTAAARFDRLTTSPVQIPGQSIKPSTELIQADLSVLGAVQQDIDGGAPVLAGPEGFAIGSEGLAPVGTIVTVGPHDIDIAATVPSIPGISRSSTFLVIDSGVTDFGAFRPMTVLVAPAAGADPRMIADTVVEILDHRAVVATTAGTVEELRSGAMAGGMRLTLYAAFATAGLAMLAALLLSVVMAAPARSRLMAIARILGLTRSQRRSLIIWEQAPVSVAALIGGVALGIGLAAMIRAAIDLAPFTGGGSAPQTVIDWVLLGLVLIGFVAVTIVAVGTGMVLTRRTTAATAIAIDEE